LIILLINTNLRRKSLELLYDAITRSHNSVKVL